MDELGNIPRKDGLVRIIQATSTLSAKAITYVAALLGIASLVPAIQLPPELLALAGGIGIEAMGNLLDRATNSDMSDADLLREVTAIISDLNLDMLLSRDDFYHAFAHLRKGQKSIVNQNEYIANLLSEIEKYIAADFPNEKTLNNHIDQRNISQEQAYRLKSDAEKMFQFAQLAPDVDILEVECTGSKDIGHKGRFIYGDFSPR